ncbi:MAG: hypothetical protein H0T80_11995 [Betaproteobacteria bacterium]|nr:hypothetical protein [Betaproteobacteria bacterium]
MVGSAGCGDAPGVVPRTLALPGGAAALLPVRSLPGCATPFAEGGGVRAALACFPRGIQHRRGFAIAAVSRSIAVVRAAVYRLVS